VPWREQKTEKKQAHTQNEKRGKSPWSYGTPSIHPSIHPLTPTKGNWVDGRSNFSWETEQKRGAYSLAKWKWSIY